VTERTIRVKPNMNQMLKQAQKMQEDMARVQEELKSEKVEASAGGGMVKVVMTGDLNVDRVVIDPAAVDPDDVAMLEDMVAAAVNEASRQAQEVASRRMGDVTGGMNIPGLM
jgi:DNA-binding YbaB/EbfC family protein